MWPLNILIAAKGNPRENIKMTTNYLKKIAIPGLFISAFLFTGANAEVTVNKSMVDQKPNIQKAAPSSEKGDGCIPFRISIA